MSMRNYPIVEKGLILRIGNLQEFAKSYKGGNEDIDEDEDYLEILENTKNGDYDFYELENVLDLLGFNLLGNLENAEFTKFKGNVNDNGSIRFGYGEYLDEDDEIFILYLDKDTLFQKYENLEDIYNEVDMFLKKNGFEVSKEFLENNIGLLCGVSFG